MDKLLTLIFWSLIGIVFYSYIGYGLLLWLMVLVKKLFLKKSNLDKKAIFFPEVTLIIPAYNERDFIDAKMQNTYSIDYPSDKLKVYWVTDGSDDGSEQYILENYCNKKEKFEVKIFHQSKRKGKSAAINRVMQFVETELVVFCDANTLINKECILNTVKHFEDEKIGCVAGEKRVLQNETTAGDGESLYWKYESWLKKLNSDFHYCIGAVGEYIAFRSSLFNPIPEDTILDDFVISMQIAHKGYRVIYEPNAYAQEAPSANEQEEMKRKVRIASGAFQALFRYPEWLNFFKHPILSFQYFSHKVTRWLIVPFSLFLIFFTNVLLFFQDNQNVLFSSTLFLQLCFYCICIIQHFAQLPSKLFRMPYYVLLMNWAMYKGLIRYLFKQQPAAWEKVKRVV
ncbi:MAG: hypothetical protein KatS3mg027_2230 [Bacteroidia bacterium]|nr:MAG: hypothetical protein KatS3mg027_2230 [Bacteroidia bacterium]